MKRNEKKLILVLILILIVVIVVKVRSGGEKERDLMKSDEMAKGNRVEEEFVQNLKDGTKLNKSEVLSQTKTLGDLEFTNIQLTNQNGQTLLLADVKNIGTIATGMQLIDVLILDKNGEQIGKISGIVSPLEAEETTQFNSSTLEDYANAYDFQVINKEVE